MSSRSSFARATTSGGKTPGARSAKAGHSVRAATWDKVKVRMNVGHTTRTHLSDEGQGLLVQALLLWISNVGRDDLVKG